MQKQIDTDLITPANAARQPFMPLLRELVRAYQAFANYDAAGYRDSDLTVSQADVIFTLGNTTGLTFKEIGELTLITKGTLTGVIDRLEQKQLVRRVAQDEDRRCTRVELTPQGKLVFETEFPRQITRLGERFQRLDAKEQAQLIVLLQKLRQAFE
ncbi:MAG: MarR family transcriptional regulator [Gammaproteobacteria bacterium]|nr:MarR family transcriptional regulator [Gammaproteobacteria bacterium]